MVGYGSVQADMVLEMELRVLHLAGNRKWSETLGRILSIYEASKPTSTMTHFLQQNHTYSNMVTPPSSANPFGGHLLSNNRTHPQYMHILI